MCSTTNLLTTPHFLFKDILQMSGPGETKSKLTSKCAARVMSRMSLPPTGLIVHTNGGVPSPSALWFNVSLFHQGKLWFQS